MHGQVLTLKTVSNISIEAIFNNYLANLRLPLKLNSQYKTKCNSFPNVFSEWYLFSNKVKKYAFKLNPFGIVCFGTDFLNYVFKNIYWGNIG